MLQTPKQVHSDSQTQNRTYRHNDNEYECLSNQKKRNRKQRKYGIENIQEKKRTNKIKEIKQT